MSKYNQRPLIDSETCVHLMSRVVQKRFLIDDEGMQELRRILRTQAKFAGLDVITFCFLKNHFHILIHIDPARATEAAVSDDEVLIERFRALYGTRRSASLGLDADELIQVLGQGGDRASSIRAKLTARMGNISVFMREFKTRFTFWYNKHYQTVGTFWAERFRSVLVEPGSDALKIVAAYIDLNAVRAGLAKNPQSYPYCGLGEAVGGLMSARLAYRWLLHRRGPENGRIARSLQAFSDYEGYVNRLMAAMPGV